MYCTKCGAKMEEDALFCAKCGSPLRAQGEPASNEPAMEQARPDESPDYASQPSHQPLQQLGAAEAGSAAAAQKKKYRKIGAIAVIAVVVAAAAVAAFVLLGGRSYEKTIDQYINSIYKADIKAYVDTLPSQVVDIIMEQYNYRSDERDAFLEDGQDILERAVESIDENFGENWTFFYDILGIYETEWREFEEAKEAYKEIGLNISEGKKVTFKIILSKKGNEHEIERTMYLIKIGNSWYVHADFSGDNFGLPWEAKS